MSRIRSKYILVALLVVVAIGTGVLLFGRQIVVPQSQTVDNPSKVFMLNSFMQNGVRVDIRLEKDNAGQMNLVATYRPTRDHYHLYSKDLPPNGIDGIGRPTLLEVASSNAIQPTGQLSESVPSIKLDATWSQQPVPVYPEGPVTLRLPIKLTQSNSTSTVADLSVTYMTCSATECLPPVTGKIVSVKLPELN